MDFILQNLQYVGPISLALLPVSVLGLVVINLRKAKSEPLSGLAAQSSVLPTSQGVVHH